MILGCRWHVGSRLLLCTYHCVISYFNILNWFKSINIWCSFLCTLASLLRFNRPSLSITPTAPSFRFHESKLHPLDGCVVICWSSSWRRNWHLQLFYHLHSRSFYYPTAIWLFWKGSIIFKSWVLSFKVSEGYRLLLFQSTMYWLSNGSGWFIFPIVRFAHSFGWTRKDLFGRP